MVSAILARRAAPQIARQIQARGVRWAHIENTHETSLPFSQGPKHKMGLAIGLASFMSFGFSLPFIAARFQLKSAG